MAENETPKPEVQAPQPLDPAVAKFYADQMGMCLAICRDLRVRLFLLSLDKMITPQAADFVTGELYASIASLQDFVTPNKKVVA